MARRLLHHPSSRPAPARTGEGSPFAHRYRLTMPGVGERLGAALLALALMTGDNEANAAAADSDSETSVCGMLREPLAFWLFRRQAGSANAGRVAGILDIERLTFTTRDGRQLGGYRLRAAVPRGYLLVAQGNAMLADQIMGELHIFRDRGLDVYVYDYRGYGLSEGKSRLAALVSDYREIVAHLNSRSYRRRVLYGMSMGGVILLNAVGLSGSFDAMVVDSSPSRISHLGCPERYDPVSHLPADSSRLTIIAGERDRVVHPAEMEELIATARSRGAQVIRRMEYAHPFQDTADIHRRRLQEVADALTR